MKPCDNPCGNPCADSCGGHARCRPDEPVRQRRSDLGEGLLQREAGRERGRDRVNERRQRGAASLEVTLPRQRGTDPRAGRGHRQEDRANEREHQCHAAITWSV